MPDIHLDVRAGATASALLGALIEVGASVEQIERVVSSLGPGPIRITVSGSGAGTAVLVRAPEGSPDVDTWGQLRPRVALLATEDEVVDGTLRVLDRLFAARAAVHRVDAVDIDLDPFSGLDDLACVLALVAAVVDLGGTRCTSSAIGHGAGTLTTLEGDVTLPGPVVSALLGDRPTSPVLVPLELLDPVAAAFLTSMTEHAAEADAHALVRATGRGRLPGRGDQASALIALLLDSHVSAR